MVDRAVLTALRIYSFFVMRDGDKVMRDKLLTR